MVVVAVVHEIAIATSSNPCRKPPRRDPEPQLFASVIVFPKRVAMACERDVRVSLDMCVCCSCWTVADCLLNVLDCFSCGKVAISSRSQHTTLSLHLLLVQDCLCNSLGCTSTKAIVLRCLAIVVRSMALVTMSLCNHVISPQVACLNMALLACASSARKRFRTRTV